MGKSTNYRYCTMGLHPGSPKPAACCRPQRLATLEAPKTIQLEGGASCFPWRGWWCFSPVKFSKSFSNLTVNTDPMLVMTSFLATKSLRVRNKNQQMTFQFSVLNRSVFPWSSCFFHVSGAIGSTAQRRAAASVEAASVEGEDLWASKDWSGVASQLATWLWLCRLNGLSLDYMIQCSLNVH